MRHHHTARTVSCSCQPVVSSSSPCEPSPVCGGTGAGLAAAVTQWLLPPALRTVLTVRGIILVLSAERVAKCCLASQLEDSALKWIEPWLRS